MPVAALSAAVARMAQAVSDPNTDLPELRHLFARDLAVCIENLQFHDRLMQQLTQAQDILAGLAANKLLARVPSVSANEGSIEGSIELF